MLDHADWHRDPLAALLGRAAAARFLEEVYERDWLVVRAAEAGAASDRFRSLVSIAEIDRIVTGTDLKEGDLLLADASRDDGVADSAYIDDQGYIDRGAVAQHYRLGATVIINQGQRLVPALGRLCQGLEWALSAHLQTNLYLTPSDAQGFPTHFDNHDVFVMQVEGEKLWRLYNVPLDTPYRGERYHSGRHIKGECVAEFTLRAGDVAYVPRGLMHDAATSGTEASLHITAGVISRTWADLVLEAVSEVALREPAFRRSLPAGYARPDFDRTEARATLAELGGILAREMRLDPAMDILSDSFLRTRAAFNDGTILGARADVAEAEFARVPHVLVRLEREDAGEHRWRLLAPGGVLWFVADSGAALTRALDGRPFRIADLDYAHGEALARRLLAYGIVHKV